MADIIREYKRPETLNLLTEEQLDALYDEDIERDRRDNEESDSWVVFDRYTRKWNKYIKDAKKYWDKLYKISEKDFYEVIHWLSVKDEPKNPNPHINRPGVIKELARAIKYAMTSKQRALAYKIIKERYERLGEDSSAEKPTDKQLEFISSLEQERQVPIYFGSTRREASEWIDKYKTYPKQNEVGIIEIELIYYLSNLMKIDPEMFTYNKGIISIEGINHKWFVGTNEQLIKFAEKVADITKVKKAIKLGKDAIDIICDEKKKIIKYRDGIYAYRCASELSDVIEELEK